MHLPEKVLHSIAHHVILSLNRPGNVAWNLFWKYMLKRRGKHYCLVFQTMPKTYKRSLLSTYDYRPRATRRSIMRLRFLHVTCKPAMCLQQKTQTGLQASYVYNRIT